MEVTLLGTGAPLRPDRATTGIMVTAAGCAPLLVDTCGGLELARQLAAGGFAVADIRNVVVTHRHLDHSGGLQALFLARIPLDIYANADTHDGIRTVTAGCFPEWEQHAGVAHHVVAAGSRCSIGGFAVTFFAARHRVPTLAVRIEAGGRTFAFSADTAPCEDVVACAENADLFVCDAICAEADGPAAAARARELMHPTARDAALMAQRARAASLACVHLGRFGSAERVQAEAAAVFDGPVSVPDDGARYRLAADADGGSWDPPGRRP